MDQDPLVTFALVRRALLRAALAAIGLTLLLLGFLLVNASLRERTLRPGELTLWALSGLFLGLVVAPLALVEEAARRRPPSVRRDALLGLATLAIAYVGFGLCILQVHYTRQIASGAPPETAWRASREALEAVSRKPSLLLLVASFVLPAVPVALVRARSIGIGWQLLLVPLVTATLEVPILILLGLAHYHVGAIASIVASAALILPLVQWAGDALAAAIGRRLGSEGQSSE